LLPGDDLILLRLAFANAVCLQLSSASGQEAQEKAKTKPGVCGLPVPVPGWVVAGRMLANGCWALARRILVPGVKVTLVLSPGDI
jgi:hypothetical protein